MAYRISNHPAVESDLFNIVEMISGYSGISVAEAKTDQITEYIDKLADFPHRGTVRNDLCPGLRAIPATDSAVVCFTVDDESKTIHILCISYAGSDWMSEIPKRL